MKEQLALQNHWRSTTHWLRWIWRWDFYFSTKCEHGGFMENSQSNNFGGKGTIEIAEALKINNILTILALEVRLFYFWTTQHRSEGFMENPTFTGQWHWRYRSNGSFRSIEDQRNIDLIAFTGEIFSILNKQYEKSRIPTFTRTLKLEMIARKVLQKHWRSTTHWPHCIWG